jgi:hypothetical protein
VAEENKRSNVKPLSPSIRAIRHSMPGKVIVQPNVTAYVNRADAEIIEPASLPKPEPTVHVTIGRIEVRATPPPVKSQKERWKPPVMSLDEYLSRQRGA